MVNYSIFPADYIYAQWDEFQPKYKEITTREGVKIIVEELADDQIKIEQIISSNPNDYLREDLKPGLVLKYHLQL